MKLSVIIVNYNVKYFLAQCLLSVEKAKKEFEKIYGQDTIETFVVDNASKDNSCEYVKKHFPEVKLIENKKNTGFSAANNQAIKISKGEYVLLLNPDTVIPEDTFIKIINFADSHPEAGGVGVKMSDGSGNFLPESKRAFPSPAVSFYKIFGLSKLFPKSKRFGKYHLSYLHKNETNEVDVLAGAFMLIRKSTIEKTGLLDETFFMYGEDIDLSYRITKSGFKNFYFPEVEIIHYKGESTKKSSINYVYVFYNAMIIFAKKHFKSKNAFLFSFLIKLAIIFRASLSGMKRIFDVLFLPACDIAVFFAGFYFLTPLWESYKFHNPGHYPPEYMQYAVPSYITIWILSIISSKGYRMPVDSKKLFKGILSGTLIILIIYSLLSEDYRYSRMLLILGTVWALFFAWLIRAVFTLLKIDKFSFQKRQKRKVLYLCNNENCEKLSKIHKQYFEQDYDRIICSDPEKKYVDAKTINKNKMSDIVLCAGKFSYKEIINFITDKKIQNAKIEIGYPDKGFIIGSSEIFVQDNIFETSEFNLNKEQSKAAKRLFDITTAIFFLVFSPVFILLTDNKLLFLKNLIKVINGELTFVGYIKTYDTEITEKLPKLKNGILPPVTYPVFDKEEAKKINFRYARNYHITDDFYVVYKTFDKISNKKL